MWPAIVGLAAMEQMSRRICMFRFRNGRGQRRAEQERSALRMDKIVYINKIVHAYKSASKNHRSRADGLGWGPVAFSRASRRLLDCAILQTRRLRIIETKVCALRRRFGGQATSTYTAVGFIRRGWRRGGFVEAHGAAMQLLADAELGAWRYIASQLLEERNNARDASRALLRYITSQLLEERNNARDEVVRLRTVHKSTQFTILRKIIRALRKERDEARAVATCLHVEMRAARDAARAASTSLRLLRDACCVICFDGPQSHAMVPCGHQCVCVTCASNFGPGCDDPRRRCPMCRAYIELPPMQIFRAGGV